MNSPYFAMDCQAKSTNDRAAARATSAGFAYTRTPGNTSLYAPLGFPPVSAIALQKIIGFVWAPGARRVVWEFGFVSLKIFKNRIHQRPGGFDAVTAVK